MTNLFERIRVEVETNPDGWATVEKAQTLAALVLGIRADVVMEIGVWSGKTLIPLSMALAHLGKGKAIGVDPWSKQDSAEGLTGEHLKWWQEVDHDRMYDRFWRRAQASGAEQFMEIHRCRSDKFDLNRLTSIDLLLIDGNHGEEASCYDVENFASRVRDGGFLFMDDPDWAKTATSKLDYYHFKKLYLLGDGVFYQRIKS